MGPGDDVLRHVRAQPHEDVGRAAEDARLAADLAGVLGRVGGLVDARNVEPYEFHSVIAGVRTGSHGEGGAQLVDGEDLGVDAREIALPGGAFDGQGGYLGLEVGWENITTPCVGDGIVARLGLVAVDIPALPRVGCEGWDVKEAAGPWALVLPGFVHARVNAPSDWIGGKPE